MVICKYFIRGNCRYGNSCRNDHSSYAEGTSILRKENDNLGFFQREQQWTFPSNAPFQSKPSTYQQQSGNFYQQNNTIAETFGGFRGDTNFRDNFNGRKPGQSILGNPAGVTWTNDIFGYNKSANSASNFQFMQHINQSNFANAANAASTFPQNAMLNPTSRTDSFFAPTAPQNYSNNTNSGFNNQQNVLSNNAYSRNIFAQNAGTSDFGNVFRNAVQDLDRRESQKFQNTSQSNNEINDDPTIYSKLEDLEESDIQEYKAESFEKHIPIKPPTRFLCNQRNK